MSANGYPAAALDRAPLESLNLTLLGHFVGSPRAIGFDVPDQEHRAGGPVTRDGSFRSCREFPT
jgi:hypothetical protein